MAGHVFVRNGAEGSARNAMPASNTRCVSCGLVWSDPPVLGECGATVHEAGVEVVAGRYPFRPSCSCGWSWRGFVADHAAQFMVDAHLAGEL